MPLNLPVRTFTAAVISILSAHGFASAQSDSCAGATSITVGEYSGDTSGATSDGAPSCGNSAGTPDLWYRYTAASDLRLTVDSCGSAYDTVLSLHTGCPANTANELACNDDTCAFGSRVRTNL